MQDVGGGGLTWPGMHLESQCLVCGLGEPALLIQDAQHSQGLLITTGSGHTVYSTAQGREYFKCAQYFKNYN